MAEQPGPVFGVVLRELRNDARLTQEELASAAGLSVRTVSDLERGVNRRARKATADLLADALGMTGVMREQFLGAALGLVPAAGVLAEPHAAAAGREHLGVRFSLPPVAAAFAGRSAELGRITAALAGAAAAGGVVVINAIWGMPGAGKTALAVHAAHLLARLLAAVGADPRFVPADLEGRAGLWRDKMADQRAVLVLDNADSSSQVTLLLPGAAGCLVLVTSRRHLGDLPGAVTQIPLNTLPPPDAADMFTRLAPRSAGDAEGVAEVVRLAGFLPLAISLLARMFNQHPCWSLANLADETEAELLKEKAESKSIAAAFEVSYRNLDPERQRFFRLLGVHPGATTDPYAAAALARTSRGEAAGHLEALYREGMLTETGWRRYSMHDLIRRDARDMAASTPADSQQAAGRLLDYYQYTAALAGDRLARQTRPGPRPPVPDRLEVPVLEDAGRALAWARAERASLLACLDHAAGTGQHDRVISLTAGLAVVLWRDGPWADAVTRHATAVDAAQRAGDRLGEANALTDLGIVRRLTGEYRGAAQALTQALRIYRHLGDQLGEAHSLRELGAMRAMTGKFAGAAKILEKSLDIYRNLSDRLGEANALRDLGTVRWLTGEYPAAAQALEQALSIFHDTGNRHGEANTLTDLGGVRQLTGDYLDAAHVLEQALGIYRADRNRHGEANALTQLGTVRRATDEYPAAAQALEQALSIWHDIGSRHGETETFNQQAALYRIRGDLGCAQQRHRQALRLARTISSAQNEARALAGLGRCAIAAGNAARAEILLRRALRIFQRIGAAETRDVLAELDDLTRPASA